ncbi:barstar family protein [Ornithinicoccus hortensis]|uniref:Barstar (Barnase inhibitor) n=1 Tax=Ornithinicoccus hortensis TaxID=82346 RepID=A0A542YND7_9MICO|nr:barstar family protein [Ornithinicoccus hortensis]TQL49567.1 barstar (barnase inhibitor) [Ornithinicoccus hortensis]
MNPTSRVLVSQVLPSLTGHGVLLASPQDVDRVRDGLSAAGFTLAEIHAPDWGGRAVDTLDSDKPATSLREAQAAIARTLRLPDGAAHNLDALVDSLRDLALWWPEDTRIALLWHGADALVDSDLPGYLELTDILRSATDDLWRGGDDGDRLFETVAFVDRHGVRTLPRVDDTSDPDHAGADQTGPGEVAGP